MARKAGNSRRRDFHGKLDIKRRKIRRGHKQSTDVNTERSATVFGVIIINQQQLARLTESVVTYSALAAYTVGCTQFGLDKNGKKYVRGSMKKRLCHYVITTLLFVGVLHKFVASVVKFNELEGRPDVETLMCMSLFLIQFVGWAMSLGLVFRWEESIEVLNTWEGLVGCIAETGQVTPYDDVSSALKIILCGLIAVGCAAGNAIVSLLFSNLPVCFYPVCKSAGLIPNIGLSPIVWQLVFLPLELAVGVMALCNGNLGGIILIESTGAQKVCLAAIKNINPSDLATRRKVEKLYAYLQIYHHLHCKWWSWTLPCNVFALSLTVILALYVGLRHTELPWYLYWVFWLGGVGCLTLIFGCGYDVMCAKEDSEETVGKLQSPVSTDLQTLSLEERKKIIKRAKAMTGLQFDIAGLANYSWSVPLGAWDEILNQLLFLFSL